MILESKSKVWKVALDDEDGSFKCYSIFDWKLVHVDVDKEITQGDGKSPNLGLPRGKTEEEKIHNDGKIGVGSNNVNGIVSVRRLSRKFRPPDCFGSIPYF